MSRRHHWKEIHNRFDPELPADRPDWRADRALSPATRIEQLLAAPFGPPRVLLLGTIGTGKSTELLRIAEARAREELVVHVDLVRHFEEVVGDLPALQRVSSWEVCFLVGLAVMKAAKERWGHRWSPAQVEALGAAWHQVAAAAEVDQPPTLDIPKLLEGMVVLASEAAIPGGSLVVSGGLKLLGAAVGAAQWAVPLGLGARALRDQDTEMRQLLDAVNDLVRTVRQDLARQVLVVLDGLDRTQDFEQARRLFIESQLLSRLDCPLVLAGPFVLRHHMATATIRGFEVETLFNEPVLDHDDPTAPGPGVEFFRELYRRRVADLDGTGLIPADLLDRLARYSGGRGRDFVRFIRNVAIQAWMDDTEQATLPLVEGVLTQARLLLESGLHRGDIDLLRQVADDPEHRLPDDPQVWKLLEYTRLLPYPNRSEWFYPHPLLTLSLVHPATAGSTPSGPAST